MTEKSPCHEKPSGLECRINFREFCCQPSCLASACTYTSIAGASAGDAPARCQIRRTRKSSGSALPRTGYPEPRSNRRYPGTRYLGTYQYFCTTITVSASFKSTMNPGTISISYLICSRAVQLYFIRTGGTIIQVDLNIYDSTVGSVQVRMCTYPSPIFKNVHVRMYWYCEY